MRKWIDVKSTVIGVIVAVSLLLLVGAAGSISTTPTIGRFRIACTNAECFVVDTATGQTWREGSTGFREPKLQGPPGAMTTTWEAFLGHWVWADPNAGQDLRIMPDGRVAYAEGSRGFVGSWPIEGARIAITVAGKVLFGELGPDGRMMMWQPGRDEKRATLSRVP